MRYTVYRTDKANDQLHDIIHYIADNTGSVDTAIAYLEKIESSIMSLGEFPYQGSVPRYRTLKRQGYRVLIVEKQMVFYKVEEENKRVIIYAVVDSRREYVRLI